MSTREPRTSLTRFGSAKIEPDLVRILGEDHPAVVEGRTVFPSTVVSSRMSPRFLVSGVNNPKLGKVVQQGDRKGWPMFHLTLQERATCPRSCDQWRSCYGGAMHQARRHDVDEDFLFLLKAEVVTMAREHDKGFLVRLHTLGDFYSVEYVNTWAKLLDACPSLHVFGYTARTLDDPDPDSRAIARAVLDLAAARWDRFAVRTSASRALSYVTPTAYVVEKVEERPNSIHCPEQLGKTTACATCGLCWSISARDKHIGFLLHGPKVRGRAPAKERFETAVDEAVTAALEIAQECTEEPRRIGSLMADAVSRLEAGLPGDTRKAVANGLSDEEQAILDQLAESAEGGVAKVPNYVLADAARINAGQVTRIIGKLAMKGHIEVLEACVTKRPGLYRVLT